MIIKEIVGWEEEEEEQQLLLLFTKAMKMFEEEAWSKEGGMPTKHLSSDEKWKNYTKEAS